MKPKIFAAYLTQFHETEDNNLFWGNGFTDWVSVKRATPLLDGQVQPRVPLDGNYYNLSDYRVIASQATLARSHGISGFNIYHYWFKNGKQELQLPAELLLNHTEIDIEFFFSWDNCSWKRTWSNVEGNDWAPINDAKTENGPAILCEQDYGSENEWEQHFLYLLPFFKDSRYLKFDGKPVFAFMTYYDIYRMEKMLVFWNDLAISHGFPGIYVLTNYLGPRRGFKKDAFFVYQPAFSAWEARNVREARIKKYLHIVPKPDYPVRYISDYDRVWKKILSFTKRNPHIIPGAFVGFDDTPRRGNKARIIVNGNPTKFGQYFKSLYSICTSNEQRVILLTAWNEWGEGAYLEPDETNEYTYLETVKEITNK